MKINEITESKDMGLDHNEGHKAPTKTSSDVNESVDAALAYADTLDSYVRSPVIHYIRNSNTDAEAISKLNGFLRDSFDDLEHGDRVAIKKVVSLIRAGR